MNTINTIIFYFEISVLCFSVGLLIYAIIRDGKNKLKN